MTQQGLADAAGIDLKTVYNLESGTRWPIARTRVAIAVALGWEGDALAEMAVAAPVPRPVPVIEFTEEDLPDEEYSPEERVVLQDFAAEFKLKVRRARRRYPGERLTGQMVFPRDPLYREMWDALSTLGWPLESLPRAMAAAMVDRPRESGESGTAAGLGVRPAVWAIR